MKLKEFEKRFELLKPHIREAGERVIQIRNSSNFEVHIKPDQSPVTNADFWSNDYFTDLIQKYFPGEDLIGEESEDKSFQKGSEIIWFIDPIDGTKHFVNGSDHFFILIGLCIEGIPEFGIIYKPITKEFVYGYGNGTVRHITKTDISRELKASKEFPDDATLIMKRVDEQLKSELKDRFGVKRHKYINDKIEMTGPLFGESNGYITMRRTAYWDLSAPAAIMRAAGYELGSTSNGDPILFNQNEYETDYYFSLPPKTPKDVKKLLFHYLS